MRSRFPSQLDHPRDYLFPIDTDLSKSYIPKCNLLDTYQRNKFTPKNNSISPRVRDLSNRIYPERIDLTRSLTPTKEFITGTSRINNKINDKELPVEKGEFVKFKVKGLQNNFQEKTLKKSLYNEGVSILYCRNNYNKITNEADGTGVLVVNKISSVSRVKQSFLKQGLEIQENVNQFGLKDIVSERFAKVLQTDRHLARQKHNYFRA